MIKNEGVRIYHAAAVMNGSDIWRIETKAGERLDQWVSFHHSLRFCLDNLPKYSTNKSKFKKFKQNCTENFKRFGKTTSGEKDTEWLYQPRWVTLCQNILFFYFIFHLRALDWRLIHCSCEFRAIGDMGFVRSSLMNKSLQRNGWWIMWLWPITSVGIWTESELLEQ